MKNHNLLTKQLNRYLPDDLQEHPAMKDFISAVSDTYFVLERDRQLAERAFEVSESEYSEINKRLKHELSVKRLSINKLKDTIEAYSGSKIFEENDDILFVADYLFQEVNKRKNAEEVFTALITNMGSGILLEDEHRRIKFVNQNFCNFFQIPLQPEKMQGLDCSTSAEMSKHLFKNPEKFVKDIAEVLKNKKLVKGQVLEMADGSILERDYIPIYLDNKYNGHVWNYTDITERKRSENAIKESELKNRLIMNAALDAIITIDHTGSITFWNPQAENIFGYSAKEALGKKLTDTIIPKVHHHGHDEGMKSYFTSGVNNVLNKQMELPAVNKLGEELTIELYIISVKQGEQTFFSSFIRDITESKRIENEKKRLGLVASANDNGIFFLDKDNVVFWSNEGCSKLTGYSAEEINGSSVYSLFVGPKSRKHIVEKLKSDFDNRKSFSLEIMIYRKDGSWFWARAKGQHVSEDSGDFNYFVMFEDITLEKQVELKLREYEEKLTLALNNVGDNYWEHNFNENITSFSNIDSHFLGFDHTTENPAKVWWDSIHPDDKHILINNDKLLKSGAIKKHSLEYRISDIHGNWRWVYDRGVVIDENEDGTPKRIIGTHIDITPQKLQEEELTKAKEAAEASTLAKELFLANMSHEIRTPMNAILGMANQLSKTPLEENQQFYLSTIRSATDNLLVIINDILDLSKIEAGELSIEKIPFEPKELVGRAMQVLAIKAEEKGVSLRQTFCDSKLNEVLIGDPYRINQILLNLMSNAIKFTEKGSVEISCTVINDFETHQSVCLTVKDTGIGMDPSFVKNLFQKFKQEDNSVSRKYGGTGLGMSICKKLVELMDGDISVSSTKGMGTEIKVYLNFEKGIKSQLPKENLTIVNTEVLADKHILIADDNEMNRLVASTILSNYNVQTSEAKDGQEVLDLLAAHTFDLILMDVQMPVMDGIEATKRIRQTHGEALPIIALTAFALKGDDKKFQMSGMNDYLSKPFEEAELLRVVSKWLSSGVMDSNISDTKVENKNESNVTEVKEKQLYSLKKLEQIGSGNQEFVAKMIQIFVDLAPASVKEMKEALIQQDFDRLSKIAHRLKPSIDNLDIDVLKGPIRAVEALKEYSAENEIQAKQLLLLIDDTIVSVVADLLTKS